MAESAVSFVLGKVSSLLIEELNLLSGLRDEVDSIQRELGAMQSFLRDADAKQGVDHRVADWVRDIREVAYDTEDSVDTYILKRHRRQRLGFAGFVKKFICFIPELRFHHNTWVEIAKIKKRLQEIDQRRASYNINTNVDANPERALVEKTMKERRELAIRRDINVIVGFEDDMERIVEILLDEKIGRQCVISIVGMGGSGKTTLVRRICNNNNVKMSFGGHCALVTVSQAYNIHKILEDIAKNFLDKEDLKRMDERELEQELYKFLQRNKYLIVLDDVWGTEMWGLIRPYIPDPKNGSRVIITTRSMNVAKAADPLIKPYELRLLRDDESWELFTKIVFPGEDAMNTCTGELKRLGENIIKRCGGLPLAINVIGGLLSMKDKIPSVWRGVLQGVDWDEMPDGGVCMQILALSYKDLPPYLKPCFLYLCCFHEDQEIDAEKLLHLWVAEGFVAQKEIKSQRKGGRTLEDEAEAWLEDLIQRSLLQVTKRNYSGRVVTCRLHDLLLDLSNKEAEATNFLQVCQEVKSMSLTDKTRRLALHCATEKGYTQQEKAYTFEEYSAPKLRTMLVMGVDLAICKTFLQFVKSLGLLRVLDLEDASCPELPSEIGDLIHLRYLGLKNNRLKSIPSTVGELHNLQTMDVRGNLYLKGLPDSLWKIITLRHIFVDWRIEPPIDCRGLADLQTLLVPAAGNWIQSGLMTMKSLRKLGISCISLANHSHLDNALDSLPQLLSLSLEGQSKDRGLVARGPLPRNALVLPRHSHLQELTLWGPLGAPNVEDAVDYDSDQLPPNLNELTLWDSRLQQDPLLLLQKLSYLKRLRLRNAYMGEEMSCFAGGFPRLEHLELRWLPIRKWNLENGSMPLLKNLEIYSCHQLEMLPDGLQHLKNLQRLEIGNMSDEFTECLKGGGKDCYKIQHIPAIQIIS